MSIREGDPLRNQNAGIADSERALEETSARLRAQHSDTPTLVRECERYDSAESREHER
jgi:hypothetical protein